MSGSELPRRTLGRSQVEATVLGVGGHIGLLLDDDDPARRRDEAIRLVQRAIALGVRYFDTSPGYGACESEEHLGAALATLDAETRASLTLSTKVGSHPDRLYQFGADDVRWCYENSRRLLGPIDILLVHDPQSDEHMETIMGPGGALEVLESLRDTGEVRAIGLGNRSHSRQRTFIDSGRADITLPSYDYHPIRQSLGPLFDRAVGAGVGIINGSPYQAGLLAGIDLDDAATVERFGDSPDLERARQIYRWSTERGVEVGALAVQWSIRDSRIGATLVGPRTVAELEANVRHATAEVPEEIWPEIAAFIDQLEPPPESGGEAF